MAESDLYVSKAQYVDYPKPQTPTPVPARAIARAGHPIIERTPRMWAPLEVDFEVEAKPAKQSAKRGGE